MVSNRRPNTGSFAGNPEAIPVQLSEEEALPLLRSGNVSGGQRIPWGSNLTFLVRIEAGPGRYLRAIYKPRDGERPLHDFPAGSLYMREYAAFVLSRALGWPDVPLTLVSDGPYGVGSLQQYVECSPEVTYFDLVGDRSKELQRFAVFDMLVNNADRKASHCLLGDDGRLWSIDHGVTFHQAFKLRTVMFTFWGKAIPQDLLDDLETLHRKLQSPDGLASQLAENLAPPETEALGESLMAMLHDPVLPVLDPYRNVPWPWV